MSNFAQLLAYSGKFKTSFIPSAFGVKTFGNSAKSRGLLNSIAAITELEGDEQPFAERIAE
jgi:hypothetical protein